MLVVLMYVWYLYFGIVQIKLAFYRQVSSWLPAWNWTPNQIHMGFPIHSAETGKTNIDKTGWMPSFLLELLVLCGPCNGQVDVAHGQKVHSQQSTHKLKPGRRDPVIPWMGHLTCGLMWGGKDDDWLIHWPNNDCWYALYKKYKLSRWRKKLVV